MYVISEADCAVGEEVGFTMSTVWDNCEHIWKVDIDSQWHSELYTAVECIKCECPGELTNSTQEVFWPST